jgi:hypothetical protein
MEAVYRIYSGIRLAEENHENFMVTRHMNIQ